MSQGDVGFTLPEEEDEKDEEESSEKEGNGKGEVKEMGSEVACSEEVGGIKAVII